MGLEDFDEAGDELELDLDQLDLSPAAGIDPNDPLNEDLFDFPEMAVFESLQEAGDQVEQAQATPEADPIVEAAMEALEDQPQPVAEATEPEPAPEPAIEGEPVMVYDPELDEDIFDFDSIFAGGDVVATPTSPEADVFVVPDNVAVPTDASPEDAAEHVADTPAPQPPQPAPVEASIDGPIEDFEALEVPMAPVSVPIVTGGRDKLVVMLAVGFLLVNTALILLAWQANSSFHGTLRDVSRGIAEGIASSQPAQAATTGPAPSVSYVPVQTTGHTPRIPGETPSDLQNVGEQTITAARLMLGEGRFLDARRNLSHLLANQDLLTLERELVAEAEYLIAESYELQGNALLEEQR